LARIACRGLTNYQASEARLKARTRPLFWARSLLRLRRRRHRESWETPGRDARPTREDVLREAAISLSLDIGIPFTGREYQLLEQLWRIDP
jgi:hypothetical protein